MAQTNRIVVAFPVGDELLARCEDEAQRVGVGKAKVMRDALTLAFLYQKGKLDTHVLPEGVACFARRKR